MKTIQTKLLISALALLSLLVVIQSYLIYDLWHAVSEDKVQLSAKTFDNTHNFLNAPNSDPFKQMQRMQEEMQKSFGQFNSMFADDPFFKEAYGKMSISPMSDIKEDTNNYIVELNIPGADEQRIEITNKNNQLHIFASQQTSKDEKSDTYLHREKYSQSFARSFTLPDDADLNNLNSDYDKGVLKITIPKKR